MQYELAAAEIMELRILADAGASPYHISDEMDLPLDVVERFLYEEEW